MKEIRIEKSLRRKIAEMFLFLWGLVGLGISLLIANEAFRFDFQSRVTETFLFGMIVYMLIWIGALVFLGFFALFHADRISSSLPSAHPLGLVARKFLQLACHILDVRRAIRPAYSCIGDKWKSPVIICHPSSVITIIGEPSWWCGGTSL